MAVRTVVEGSRAARTPFGIPSMPSDIASDQQPLYLLVLELIMVAKIPTSLRL